MLGKAINISLFRSDPISRKTLRYALGIAISIAVAFGFDWPLSFLVIILVNTFLLGTKPTFKIGLSFIIVISISVFAGIILSYFLLEYEYIYLMVIGIVLLNLYYASSETLPPILKLFLIVFILVIPLISLQSLSLGSLVGTMFLVGGIVSLLITWLVYSLLPDMEIKTPSAKPQENAQLQQASPKERFEMAVRSLVVVFPMVVLFYYFNLQNSALILIYVAMYSSNPDFAKDFTKGKDLLIGTITGGIISYIMYELVVTVPMFSFLILLFFGLALWIGNQILTNKKYAEQVKAGFSTVIIIFGSAVSNNEVDAGGKIISRVIQIAFVVIYMVLAFGLIEKLFPKKTSNRLSN